MSISVSATPFLLLSGLITTLIETTQQLKQEDSNYNQLNDKLKNLMQNNENITEEALQEITKEYLTVFMDKDVLVKTLSEHGAENIEFENDNIICSLDCFTLRFTKNENNSAYTMNISANCDEEKISELVNDINEEYALNTQEETYIKIKERLDKQGLQIDEEEVLEDNSIMLTINV